VWVDTRAIILLELILGKGSIIGAGTVVTKAVPCHAMWVGNPARGVRCHNQTQVPAAKIDQFEQTAT
jgi:acetyltransferase-like isoleucine patch superfamily enzyme